MAGFALAMLTACSDDDDNNGGGGQPDQTRLFTSSNTTGMISITDLSGTTPTVKSFSGASLDADGIYYNEATDEIFQASRTNNRIDVFGGINAAFDSNLSSLSILASSTSDFTNAREIAVSGNMLVVAQDQSDANGLQNKLYLYQRSGNAFALQKTFDVDIKLWGIHMEGSTLFAVVDNTADIAVFDNFAANASGPITPNKRFAVEGLVRTHGITHDDNTMVLTDVGLAASDSDGGLIVIPNFSSVLSSTANGGTIALSAQKRIYGPMSKLGNPVDVAYDDDTNRIYVAERLNGGGQVLTFAMPTAASADVAPISSRVEAGVSAVYLQD